MIARFFLFFALLICSASINLNAQNHSREFEISLPETKVANSLYNKISFLDSRDDTTQMGIIQTGAFNRKTNVIVKKPFAAQLNNLMTSLIDNSAKGGELLFQLRQLSFAEITGAVSEKGYSFFRAMLYKKVADRYSLLSFIDTAVILKSSWDVTRGIFRSGSKLVSSFVTDNLLQTPAPTASEITFSDVLKIDSIEKAAIKIYTDTAWQDGIYLTWNSFKQQLADNTVAEAVVKNGELKSLKINGDNGKPEKVKSKNIYAVVYKGLPFIATDYGYYPLEKSNGELFFTGKAKVTANAGDVIAAGIFFGIIGSLLASDATSSFDMKIDHLSGGFIRLREIKNTGSE